MESPVVIDKPPEYHGNARDNERGFPFDEEEGSGAWSELAARHPDIAARLRQRPATWARKRRPSSQDATDDFGESFSGFDRFPFDDIPPEFRDHFPTHWNRRFSSRDEPDRTQPPAAPPAPPSPQHHTAATQTDHSPAQPEHAHQTHLPQYGLRNTVDLGQKSAADPSLVDADDRNQRSMSAPPDSCTQNQSTSRMSAQNQQEHLPPHAEQPQQPSNVRHIPIFVEGRDEPVINKSVDHGTHFGDAKPAYVPPPQPHVEREQYFDDGPTFHAPTNFSRAFGTPFNKGFRQGPQPFVQQKVYPQNAFTRGASPQRSQSPKPQSPQTHPDEHFVKVPVHHEQAAPRAEPPPQPRPQQPPAPKQPAAPKQPTPPPQPKPQDKPAPSPNDPITQILSIQTDVLNLMSEVENFTGTKKDKKYLFLDEMLTRNLIKLDNIETEGKENIRQARKEAIKCIQKCIAVLEAKADKGSNAAADVEMEKAEAPEPAAENGEVEMKEAPKEEDKVEPQTEPQPKVESQEVKEGEAPQKAEAAPAEDAAAAAAAAAADTRPGEPAPAADKDPELDKKTSPKKGGKNVKKRDKSKDNKDKDSKDSNKEQTETTKEETRADEQGDKAQAMDVDGAASQ